MRIKENKAVKNIRLVRHSRKNKWLDKIVLRLFKKVFLRWCDQHLNRAHEFSIINNNQLHSLDAQMKGDLGFPGYAQPSKMETVIHTIPKEYFNQGK